MFTLALHSRTGCRIIRFPLREAAAGNSETRTSCAVSRGRRSDDKGRAEWNEF
ncbi:MAG: hypothetical protein MPL62_03005 [Alphaproteobacteria bacterium]|nr:hypothetical protein [Alphaproteobacteria bacterium]